MQRTSELFLAICLLVASAAGQVVSPADIKDPELRGLQQQYFDDLKWLGSAVLATPTEFPF